MKYAYENSIPVTPRGAGTNLVGSTVPDHGGIILDVSGMNRIEELDEDTLSVTVQPGVLLKDIQAYVEERGLFYPPDPGEKESSIGGNISTNAGGMRAVKYGVTRDFVRALEGKCSIKCTCSKKCSTEKLNLKLNILSDEMKVSDQ